MIRALLLLVAASCYAPSYRDCEITCSTGSCPSGFSCDQGVCRVDGFAGPCGSTTDDAGPRSDGVLADTAGPDATCDYRCTSTTGAGGTAACQQPTNQCSTAFAWFDRIDICTCSAGFPELYVIPDTTGSKASVALVAMVPSTGFAVSLMAPDGTCYGGGDPCPGTPLAGCAMNTARTAWNSIPIVTGATNRFTIHDDVGTGCGTMRYIFNVQL